MRTTTYLNKRGPKPQQILRQLRPQLSPLLLKLLLRPTPAIVILQYPRILDVKRAEVKPNLRRATKRGQGTAALALGGYLAGALPSLYEFFVGDHHPCHTCNQK